MSAPFSNLATPKSILDTDLYKLTMQQAVLHHFPTAQSKYRFTNRDLNTVFSRHCIERFRTAVAEFTDLSLTAEEYEWLKSTCPDMKPAYLDYLASYRFKPEQLDISFVPTSADGLKGRVEIEASGPWVETILWEVPLMACLSEAYFQTMDVDWSYEGQEERATEKAKALLGEGCVFADFGTRRRRSYQSQDIVLQALLNASREHHGKGKCSGTSNAHLARKYGVAPIGTIAHEWFMGVGAINGYETANSSALDLWEEVYPNGPLIALTDTFSSKAFFDSFLSHPEQAQKWMGLRQDSGDPFKFAPRAKEVYDSLGIDAREKAIIFSDSLSVEKAILLKKQCADLGLEKVSFGIGTFFTNDFRTLSSGGTEKSKALNMVIKLASVDDKPCVKISDDLTKNTGDRKTIEHVKRLFSLG